MTDDAQKTISYRRVVDLTHPIHPGIPRWPGDPPVRFETVTSISGDGYFLRRFGMGEHSGTHISTASAFHPDGDGPDRLPPERLIAPAVVIDAAATARRNPDYYLTPDDLDNWERMHGPVPAGSLVMLFTGWQRYWPTPERFINADALGAMHTPGFGTDAAKFLLEQRNVAGLGIDTHGVDPGQDPELSVSRMGLGHGAIVLECLNNLNDLPPTGATIIIGRLPLVGGSGSPASILALVP